MTHTDAIAWAVRQRFERHGLHATKVMADDDMLFVLCPELKRMGLQRVTNRVGFDISVTHENGADVLSFDLYPVTAKMFDALEEAAAA